MELGVCDLGCHPYRNPSFHAVLPHSDRIARTPCSQVDLWVCRRFFPDLRSACLADLCRHRRRNSEVKDSVDRNLHRHRTLLSTADGVICCRNHCDVVACAASSIRLRPACRDFDLGSSEETKTEEEINETRIPTRKRYFRVAAKNLIFAVGGSND
jgi:hypothetical protein